MPSAAGDHAAGDGGAGEEERWRGRAAVDVALPAAQGGSVKGTLHRAVSRALDWSLLHGVVPFAVSAVAIAALGLLLFRAGWRRGLVACAGAATVALAGGYLVDNVWRPFPDRLPPMVLVWAACAIAALALAVSRRRGRQWIAAAAVVVTLVGSVSEINALYGQYDSLRSALGMRPKNVIAIEDVNNTTAITSSGRLMSAPIPGPRSGFSGRAAWVYLPPAYLTMPRPKLPVLMLISGQPGNPRDWIDGGHVDQVMDEWARKHGGVAPIVVLPDGLGSLMANPLCMDSRLANAETYLAEDVPAWLQEHLDVDPDPRHWAVGGYSYGGTCAWQLGVRRPGRFATFLDISGQAEPSLSTRAATVSAAFGGDAAAFARANPHDIMAAQPFPDTTALVVAGREDAEYGPQQKAVKADCERAGMRVEWWELPGGHNWEVWGRGLVVALPVLAERMGIAR